MFSSISQNHPLRALFAKLVQTRLLGTAQLNDIAAATYVTGVLVDLSHVDNLYKIRNSRGKALKDVGEMLIVSNPIFEGHSFIHEREVRKHIGDYTLFLAGIFPEYVARMHRQRRRLDCSSTILKLGKSLIRSLRHSINLNSRTRRRSFGAYPNASNYVCSASIW